MKTSASTAGTPALCVGASGVAPASCAFARGTAGALADSPEAAAARSRAAILRLVFRDEECAEDVCDSWPGMPCMPQQAAGHLPFESKVNGQNFFGSLATSSPTTAHTSSGAAI